MQKQNKIIQYCEARLNIQLSSNQINAINNIIDQFANTDQIFQSLIQKIDELSSPVKPCVIVNNLVSFLLELTLKFNNQQIFAVGDTHTIISQTYMIVQNILGQLVNIQKLDDEKTLQLEEKTIYFATIHQIQKISVNKQKYQIQPNLVLYFTCVEQFNQSEIMQIEQLHEAFYIQKSQINLLCARNLVNINLQMYLQLLQENNYQILQYIIGESSIWPLCHHQQLFTKNFKQQVQLLQSLCSHLTSSVFVITRSNQTAQNIYQQLQQAEYDSYFDQYAKAILQHMHNYQYFGNQRRQEINIDQILLLRPEINKQLKLERIQRIQTQSSYIILSSDYILSQIPYIQPEILISVDIPDDDYLYKRFFIPKSNYIQIVIENDEPSQLYLTFLIDNEIKVNRKYAEKLVIQTSENDQEWLNQVLDLL